MNSKPPDNVARSAPIRQLVGIQYLRAIAALMVAMLHTTIQIPALQTSFDTLLVGKLNLASGVDIFFVISGFIMMVTNRTSTPWQFAIRRIVRIVPLYWILTTLLAVLVVSQPQLFRTTLASAEFFVKSLLFIPYQNPGHPGEVSPILPAGWSLNFEMFFYAVFALVLLAPEKRRVGIVGVIFAALLAFGWILSHALPLELRFYTNYRLIEFWLGMVIAHFFLMGDFKVKQVPAAIIVLAGIIVLLTATLGSGSDSLIFNSLARNALPAAAIIFGMVAFEQRGLLPNWPVLHGLGDASYSIYLTHIFTLGAARLIWTHLGLAHVGALYAIGFALFAMVMVIAVAWITYRLVENPILLVLHRRLRRPRPVAPTIDIRIEPPAGG